MCRSRQEDAIDLNISPDDLVVRPLAGPHELELFQHLDYVNDDEYAEDLALGRRLPGWMWIAMAGDRVVARAAWWTRVPGDAPLVLDVLDLDDALDPEVAVAVGTHLLRTALAAVVDPGATPPEYSRTVPPRWREDPFERRVVETRMAVLTSLGATLLVERFRLDWDPASPVPEPSSRLRFRPVADETELLDLMERVLPGTLDAHSRTQLETMTAREAAREHFEDELATFTTPRTWWHVGVLPDGTVVGFVIPARNNYNPIISYIGVLPEHRGHGYIDDLLAVGTRILARHEVPLVRAATDFGNVPMARAFARAGYAHTAGVIDMTW